MSEASEQAPRATRRAPHMERYVKVQPIPEESPESYQVRLQIGVQSFLISRGHKVNHDEKEFAEWYRDMLCIALDTLRSEVIEECAAAINRLSEAWSPRRDEDAVDPVEAFEDAVAAIRAMKGNANG